MITEEDIYVIIEKWIEDEVSLKEALRRLGKHGRKLGNLDQAFISKTYLEMLSESWFESACQRARENIGKLDERPQVDLIGLEFDQLDENDSLEHLLDWPMIEPTTHTDRLLLRHKDLFEGTGQLKEYVYRLRHHCKELLIQGFLAKSSFCSAFSEYLEVFVQMLEDINLNVKRRDIVQSHVSQYLEGKTSSIKFIQRLTTSFEKVQPNVGLFYARRIPTELPSNASSLLTAIVKQLMLPETSIQVRKQNELGLIEVRGVSVILDSDLSNTLANRLVDARIEIDELRIVGLKAVHIKCNLDKSIWHGINISIVTENLIVNDSCVWDVSGLEASHRYGGPAASGTNPGEDGTAGEHGYPGESGGNVLIVCKKHYNLQDLRLVSDGGRGSDGQGGGDGADGADGKDAWKLTKSAFQDKFPSMSYLKGETAGANYRKVISSLENYSGTSYDTKPFADFFIECKEKESGREIIASFYQLPFVRQSLVLVKGGVGEKGQRGGMGGVGGKGGLGGFYGTIQIKTFDGTRIYEHQHARGDRAESGADGNSGRGGKHGKQGKAAGDVACMDYLSSGTTAGLFYGFDREERLILRCDSVRACRVWLAAPKETYAHIEAEPLPPQQATRGTREEKLANQKRIQEATKKKAVDQQEIKKNANQVLQFSAAPYSLVKSAQNQMNALDVGLKDAVEDIKMAGDEFKEETVKAKMQHKELKSKIDLARENEIKVSVKLLAKIEPCQLCDESCCLAKANGRCINTRGPISPSPEALVGCLVEQSTAEGVDNILHCIFGQANDVGVYTCNDALQRRTDLAKAIRQKKSDPQLLHARSVAIRRFACVLDNGNKYPEVHRLKLTIRNVVEQMQTFTENLTRPENSHLGQFILNGDDEEGKLSQEQLTGSLEQCGPHLVKLMQAVASELDVDEQLESTSAMVEEYARYVESPLTTLDLPEVALLAVISKRKIHVYKMRPNLTLVETINPEGDDETYVVHTNKGTWQRLEPDQHRRELQRHRARLALECRRRLQSQQSQTKSNDADSSAKRRSAYERRKLFRDSHGESAIENEQEQQIKAVRNWIEKTNDAELSSLSSKLQYVAVEGLHQQLGDAFTRDGVCLSHNEFRYLLECLLDATPEDGAIMADIVSSFCQPRWKQELLLMEMEDAVGRVITEKSEWRRLLYRVNDESLFFLLRDSLSRTDDPSANKILETLKMLAENLDIDGADYERLCQLSVQEWCFELQGKYWEKRLQRFNWPPDGTKSAVYCLLELSNKFGERFCSDILERCFENKLDMKSISELLLQGLASDDKEVLWKKLDTYSSTWYSRMYKAVVSTISAEKERTLQELVPIIQNDGNTSATVKDALVDVGDAIKSAKKSKTVPLDQLRKGFNLRRHVSDFLVLFNEEVKRIYGYHVRDTQLVAIGCLLLGRENGLAQVSTGEGKSLIVAAVAIARALCGDHVDVVTSNSVLAIRDSTRDPTCKSIHDVYEAFGVSVSNICHHDDEKRSAAYRASVVYGELSYFQKDHLLDTFYDKNIRGDRRFDSVIVDEVDCLLLDRGNNVLYLSHDIPGMESLESLYVFIWEKLCLSSATLAEIKSAVLYDLYGIIQVEDLNHLRRNMSLQDRNALWTHLIQIEVINQRGQVLRPSSQITEASIAFDLKPEYNGRVAYYLRNVADRQRQILVAECLLPFVDRHLDTVLENAAYALLLNDKQHYIVDQDRTKRGIDLNPVVTIIDADTGTDQAHSQWDGALHQFLQLKERCQLSLQSLKAVFISNVSYIKKYRRLSGLTGTLGSNPERSYLTSIYETDYFTVPTAFAKKFELRPAQVLGTRETWLATIVREVQLVLNSNRSLLVVCKSIQDVEDIGEKLTKAGIGNVQQYVRDYEQLEIGSLEPGQVIVATNLAGRGTDIKLSPILRVNGGLHVCLTFLPDNVRIEEQAFGRSARNGAPGSGQMIIHQPSTCDSWPPGKIFELKEERNRNELLRISKLERDFRSNIKVQEMCFDKFTSTFKEVKKRLASFMFSKEQSEIVGLCALDSWALWLDAIEPDLTRLDAAVILRRFEDELIGQLIPADQSPQQTEEGWIDWLLGWLKSPARLVPLAKHLALSRKPDLADRLLSHLVEIDDFFYPAAHYYKALCVVKRTNLESESDMAEFESHLSDAERVLRKHAQSYSNYAAVVEKIAKGSTQSFYVNEAYSKQKENMAYLLELLLHSITTLKGAACTSAALIEHGVKESTADETFKTLMKHRFINPCHFDLDRKTSLRTVCDGYGIPVDEVSRALKEIRRTFAGRTDLTEDRLAKELKKQGLFYTRAAFWKYLVGKRVLFNEQKYVMVHSSLVDKDGSLYGLRVETFEKSQKAEKVPVILYDPVRNVDFMAAEDKLLFHKADVKRFFGGEYVRMKRKFDLNKCATLDRDELARLDWAELQVLTREDLDSERIPRSEWDPIWQSLIDQKIITGNGRCAIPIGECTVDATRSCNSLFAMKFQDCPMYEEAVNYIVKRKFVAHRVLHAFVHEQYDAINQLPLNPHCSLLFDLQSEGIVILPAVNRDIVDYESQLENIYTGKEHEDTRKAIVTYLSSNRPAYVGLETVDASLKDLSKGLEGQKGHDSIATELYTLSLVGFDQTIEIAAQKWSWKMLTRSALVIAFGVAQVIVGAYIEMQSAGFMTHVATGLMSEGVSDILFAMSALYSGNNFTWSDYKQHKVISLAITVAAGGIGYCFSKGVNFYKYGYKLGGPALQVGGESVATHVIKDLSFKTISKEVAKTTSSKIIKGVGLGLVNHAVESFVTNQLRSFCQSLARTVTGDLDKRISESGLADKLGRLYRVKKEQATLTLNNKVNEVLFGPSWLNSIKNWMSRLINAFSQGLSNALSKRRLSDEWQLLNMTAKATMMVGKLKAALDSLNSISSLVSDNLTKLERELETELKEGDQSKVETDRERQFKEQAINKLRDQMQQNAEQKVAELTTIVLQTASTYVVQQSARFVKKQFKDWKESRYMKEFMKERDEFKKASQNQNASAEYSVDQSQKDAYHNKLLKLAAKTKNPKLIAELMREGVPIDRFGAQAVALAIKDIAKSQGINMDNVDFKITTSDGQYSHVSSDCGSESIELWLERATDDTFGHYASGGSSEGNDCVISAFEEQLRKTYPDLKLDPGQVRELAARYIENDPSISSAIKQGWHRYTYEKGMFGGNKRFKSKDDSEGRVGPYETNQLYSKKGVTNADHQPSTSSWKNAKHDNIKEIPRDQHPTLQIPEEDHKNTKNYGFPWWSKNQEFLAKQEKYMDGGEYHEAIWHAVETNWLDNFILGMEDGEKKKKYLESVRQFFGSYYNLTKNTKSGNNELIMTKKQLRELNHRLDQKIAESNLNSRQP